MDIIDKLWEIEDPVRRRMFFLALLSEEIRNRGGRSPILVGGGALELYTSGSYSTGDIDLKAPIKLTTSILKEWGFSKAGRVWVNPDLDIYVDLLGESLEEGKEAEKRVEEIEILPGYQIAVLSIEDLIIDRLNAAKWWQDQDSLMWSVVLVSLAEHLKRDLDIGYLRGRAQQDDLIDLLEEVLAEASRTAPSEEDAPSQKSPST